VRGTSPLPLQLHNHRRVSSSQCRGSPGIFSAPIAEVRATVISCLYHFVAHTALLRQTTWNSIPLTRTYTHGKNDAFRILVYTDLRNTIRSPGGLFTSPVIVQLNCSDILQITEETRNLWVRCQMHPKEATLPVRTDSLAGGLAACAGQNTNLVLASSAGRL
jgi:hypothetical protein